jgi:CO dehydrogenase/acetyl-CoA synthase delta subunit
MSLELAKRNYSGAIRSCKIGEGEKSFTVGGETAFSFYLFEGQMPHTPRIGLNILDVKPDNYAASLLQSYGEVVGDPAAWAKKCVALGADLVQITLAGTDPNDKNLGPEHAVEVVKKVAAAVDVPISVWGCGNEEKDALVLRAVAEAMAGRRLCIGPVQEKNHKQVGAACLAYKHVAIASTPIDINLAKQLNVLLGNLGVSDDNILIDPTVGALGYGLEYTFSVMERARLAALCQQDERLQFPIYCNVGSEVWKTKEAKLPDNEMKLGEASKRGVLMEAITASALLTAGADILVLCHPESLKVVRKLISELIK